MKFLIQTGPGIGDMIQLFHMAHAIKKQHSDAQIDFLMTGNAALKTDLELLSLQNDVRHLYWYSKKAIFHDMKLIAELRKNGYDYGIARITNMSIKPSLWVYRIMRLAGCKKVIGTGYSGLDRLVDIPPRAHFTERNAMILRSIDVQASEEDLLSIDKSKLATDWFRSLEIPDGMKIVSLSLGTNPVSWKEKGTCTTYDVKSWGYEKWLTLAQRLAEKGVQVFLLGGKKEKAEVEVLGLPICQNQNICNMLGKTTVTESLTILEKSDLAIGAEGGMMHCAGALQTKTLTVFGGTDPLKWNPGGKNGEIICLNKACGPCFLTRRAVDCKSRECLALITVDMVYDKACEMLEIS